MIRPGVGERFKHRTMTLEQFGVSADEKAKAADGGGLDPAAGRRLQHRDSPGPGGAGQHPSDGGGGAGHIDPGGCARQGRKHASWRQHQMAQFRAAGQHGDQDIRRGRDRGSRAAPAGTTSDDGGLEFFAHVSGHDVVTGPDQVRAHRQPHPAHADKTNSHGLAPSRCRIPAGRYAFRSPDRRDHGQTVNL